MRNRLNQNETMDDVIRELETSFKTVSSIAPVAYWYENLNENGRIRDIHYSDRMREMLGYRSVAEFPDELDTLMRLVHPDDVNIMLDDAIAAGTGKISQYDVRYRIRKADGEYLWCKATGQVVRDWCGKTVGMYGSFLDISSEMELHRKTDIENKKLIEKLLKTYNLAYTVDLSDASFELLKMDRGVIGEGMYFADFTEAVRFFLEKVAYEQDREMLRQELDFDTIRKRVRAENRYVVEYRAVIGKATVWHEMTVFSLEKEKVAIGFVMKDLEITRKHLEDIRYNEFFALYEIDMDSDLMKIIKYSPYCGIDSSAMVVPFRETVLKFASGLDEEARESFSQLADFESVKKRFANDNKAHFSFRFNNLGNIGWVYCMIYITLRHSDETPAVFTIGFSRMDSIGVRKQELQRLHREDLKMIGGLASEYSSLFYVNMDEGTYKTYAIDRIKTSKAPQEILKAQDFFGRVRLYAHSDIIHPDDRKLFDDFHAETVRKKLSGNKKYSVRFRLKAADGYRWEEMDVVKYERVDERANVIAVGFADRDTEIRRERERERQLRKALENAEREALRNDLVMGLMNVSKWFCEISAEDTVAFVGKRESITGTKDSGWNGDIIAQVNKLHPEDKERVQKEFKAAISDHSGTIIFNSTFRLREKDGRTPWIKAVGKVLRREDGTGELIGMDLDITEQMEEQQKRLLGAVPLSSDVMAKADIGMWAIEMDKEQPPRMYVDEAMLELVGLDRRSAPDDTFRFWFERIDKASLGLVHDAFERMKAGEHAEVQLPWHHPDGHTVIFRGGGMRNPAYTKGVRLEGTNQNVSEVIHFDEEEMKRTEQQRKNEIARIVAESANKAKTDFLFNMSHDIRTPMNAITGFTAMAKKYVNDSEKVSDYLGKIEKSGQQLLTLINQVLEMARIESGKIELQEEPVDVRKEYGDMVTVLSEQMLVNGLKYHYTLGDIEHNHVLTDKARVNSIVLNIVGNAIKYTPQGGTIDYRLKEMSARKPGYATFLFTVEDTGIGMSREYLKTIFEPFTREKTSTVSRIQGTGLGMSIVKSIVDLLGGNIEVQSEQGKGTRFDVTLDFKINEEAKEKPETPLSQTVSFEGRRVLLAEDNELNREIAVDILEEAGMVVEEAEDGSRAVEIVREKGADSFDFILMDIQMPIMDGYEATKVIRTRYPNAKVPIIALSANAFEEDKTASREAGMNDHVAKPINLSELFGVLSKYL